MKRLIIFGLLFGLSCSKTVDLPDSSSNKNENKNPINENYKSITLQHFTQASNQIGFDIMPVSSEGTPIGCDDTSLEFKVEKYFNGQLVEDSSNISIDCKNSEAVEVGLVLDNSGSVRDYRLIVENSVNSLLSKLFSLDSKVSLTEVNTNSRVLSPVTKNMLDFKSGMKKLSNKGGWTALYDGIRMSHDTLIEKIKLDNEVVNACNYKRKAIIVMTDGEENNSCEQKYEEYSLEDFPGDKVDTTLEDLLKLKIDNRTIPIFSLGVGESIDQESLSNISNNSGASYMALNSFSDVSSAFNDISNYLQAPYQVCFNTNNIECGDYKIVVDYSSENGPAGQKVLEYIVACSQDEDTEETTRNTTEEFINEEPIETADGQNELELNYSKEVVYPLFHDDNGRKELITVNLHFESIKNLDLTTVGSSNLERQSSFNISDKTGEIINLEKSFNVTERFDQGFSDKQTLKGIYKIPSSYFSLFIGEGKDEISFTAKDFLKWNTTEKITGNLQIVGNFIIEYIWRYRQREGVIIPDSNLRLAVRNATGIRVGDITPEAMEKITKIDVRNKEVSTFEGLQYAINLNEILLSNTKTRDISFLKVFEKLEYLDASTNTIEDFSVLNEVLTLKHLYLNNTNLSNANDISKLLSLKTLQAKNTDLIDIYPFKALTSLATLSLRNCKINNFSYFKILRALSSLDLYGCKNNPNESFELNSENTYSYLNIGNTDFSKIERLSGYEISNLVISHNELSSLEGITQIRNLKILSANNNNLDHVDYLAALEVVNLKTLNLNSNLINDLTAKNLHNSINTLYVQSNKLSNLDGLVMFPNLYRIYISFNNVESLSILAKMSKIQLISAVSTTSNGVEDLAQLPLLNYLDLTSTDLSTLPSLDFSLFPSLSSLIMRSTNNSNLSFLTKENFSSLDIRYNELTCIEQKMIVDQQYLGKVINYTLVEDCPYVYQSGASTREYDIQDRQDLGIDFFGDFDTSNLLETMSGSYTGSFEPIELNKSETLQGVSIKLEMKIDTTLSTNEQSDFIVTLFDNMTLKLRTDSNVFHESKFEVKKLVDVDSGDTIIELKTNFSETSKLNETEVNMIKNSVKVFFELNYASTPSLNDSLDREFSVDNSSIGHLEINYHLLQEL